MTFVFSHRFWGLVFAGLSALVLAAVYISQYGFGLQPCHLCLMQRIPFAVAIALGILLFTAPQKYSQYILWALALTFLIGMGLAIFHTGVEYKWWTYNSGCTGSAFKPGATTAEIMAALKAAPSVRCDERVVFLFGMTMAFYNALTSAGLTILALFASHNASGE